MQVYRSHRASKVHFNRECPAWVNSTARLPLEPVELSTLKAAQFCLVCAPKPLHHRPETLHRLCTVCNWKRPMPCRHNGGVAVVNVDDMEHYGERRRRVNVRWRWPENVLGAPLAPDSTLV